MFYVYTHLRREKKWRNHERLFEDGAAGRLAVFRFRGIQLMLLAERLHL
jgi:hypothetical protein